MTSIFGLVMDHADERAIKRDGDLLTVACPLCKTGTLRMRFDVAGGFYHCLRCGKAGDRIAFVMEAEGVSFEAARRTVGLRDEESRAWRAEYMAEARAARTPETASAMAAMGRDEPLSGDVFVTKAGVEWRVIMPGANGAGVFLVCDATDVRRYMQIATMAKRGMRFVRGRDPS